MENYSFRKGFDQVPVGIVKKVKAELMSALGVKSYPAWLNRLRGNIEPKVSEVQAIEKVFANYGITNIWGS